jgi:hypothetical protein
MIRNQSSTRPAPWSEQRAQVRHPALVPLLAFDWVWQWVAWLLSNWSFLQVLEYLGSFSVLIAVIFWFSESGDRVKQRHYQAWQVINTAQGKGGSGGRIEALQELNTDHVALTGVDASSAFLQGIRLEHAKLSRSDFSAADLRNSHLRFADFSWADLHYANLRDSDLQQTAFDHANLSNCDLFGTNLTDAHLDEAILAGADLRGADLNNISWQHIGAIAGANIAGLRHPPPGFIAWALQNGAIQNPGPP